MWEFIKTALYSSAPERSGMLMLCLAVLVYIGVKQYLAHRNTDVPEALLAQLRELEEQAYGQSSHDVVVFETVEEKNDKPEATPNLDKSYHIFDPNNASTKDWEQFGLTQAQIDVINNYRNSIGGFERAEDLLQVFVIDSARYERMHPYLNVVTDTVVSKDNLFLPVQEALVVDINKADSSLLFELPGIGEVLSARIVNYRSLLGGFYSVDQLQEVYGIDEALYGSLVGNIVIGTYDVEVIDINTATLVELSEHPYLTYTQAKSIIKYREAHGLFTSIDGIEQIHTIDDNTFDKIAPYLEVKSPL